MECLRLKLDSIVAYLTPWLPLANSHMVSFISQDLWSKHIPEDIQNEFQTLNAKDCYPLFFEKSRSNNPKLYSFISSAEENARNDGFINVEQVKAKIESWGFANFKSFECGKQFMSSKKSHEVQIMSEIVAALAEATGTEVIVDIGDGKGYLSSMLSLEYKLNIIGIDSSPQNTSGANKRVIKMKKHWNGVKKSMKVTGETTEKGPSCYFQHTQFIKFDTDISSIVNQLFPSNQDSLGLVGLHTCGELSPVCLSQFADNNFKFILNVGCCYHLMEEGNGSGGFPLSEYLKKKNFRLGRNARMLSLQAPARISASKNISTESLMFRAVFEQLLLDKTPYDVNPQVEVGRISAKCKNFVEYCKKANSKLPYELNMTDKEIDDYLLSYSDIEPKLQFYFILRVFLAPVIEKVILYDRLLFLKEKGFAESYLVELFDPVVSPRCYGILSVKP